jgi:hypothetical protein
MWQTYDGWSGYKNRLPRSRHNRVPYIQYGFYNVQTGSGYTYSWGATVAGIGIQAETDHSVDVGVPALYNLTGKAVQVRKVTLVAVPAAVRLLDVAAHPGQATGVVAGNLRKLCRHSYPSYPATAAVTRPHSESNWFLVLAINSPDQAGTTSARSRSTTPPADRTAGSTRTSSRQSTSSPRPWTPNHSSADAHDSRALAQGGTRYAYEPGRMDRQGRQSPTEKTDPAKVLHLCPLLRLDSAHTTRSGAWVGSAFGFCTRC